jgi:hypothetical protein
MLRRWVRLFGRDRDMSIFITHSGIYGTEDWFDGDVQVYDNTEVEADCAPVETYYRSLPQGFPLQTTHNPLGGFTGLNLAASLIEERYNPTFGQYPTRSQILSSTTHSYFMYPGYIGEFDIEEDEVTHIFEVVGSIDTWSLISERKMFAVVRLTSSNSIMRYRIYDFETETYDEIYTRDIFESDDSTYNKHIWVGFSVTIRVGLELVTAVYHMSFTYPWDPPNRKIPKVIVHTYNHSTEVFDFSNETLVASTDFIDSVDAYMYGAPVMAGNKFISAYNNYGEDPVTEEYILEFPFVIYDFDANQASTVILEDTGGFVYDMGYHQPTNSVYFMTEDHNEGDYPDSIGRSIRRLNLTSNTFSVVKSNNYPDAHWFGIINSKDRAYVYEQMGMGEAATETSIYSINDLDNPLVVIPDAGFGHTVLGNMSGSIDERNNMVWVFNNDTDELIGYPLDGGDPVSFELGIPGSDVFPWRTMMYIQGEYMFIATLFTETGRTQTYIVRNI